MPDDKTTKDLISQNKSLVLEVRKLRSEVHDLSIVLGRLSRAITQIDITLEYNRKNEHE